MKKEYIVYAVGGDVDGKEVARFTNEADATNYGYDHSDDYPLGCAIFDSDGKEIIGW